MIAPRLLALPFPAPTISLELAARCPVARHARDYQLARWCGIPGHELDDFIDQLTEFDARTRIHRRHERKLATKTLEDSMGDTLLADIAAWNQEDERRQALKPPMPPWPPHVAHRPPEPAEAIPDPYMERQAESYAEARDHEHAA